MKAGNRDTLTARGFRALCKILFPTRCLSCGLLFNQKRQPTFALPEMQNAVPPAFADDMHWLFANEMASLICPVCAGGFKAVKPPICPICGVMFKSREGEDHICGPCMEVEAVFQSARALGVYDQVLMSIIHRLKYSGKIQLARPLGRLLFAAFNHFWQAGEIEVILPVPLHRRRFRKRGFNQAYLLIKEWSQFPVANRKKSPEWQVRKDVIKRIRPTVAQTGLNRQQRLRNMRKAFRVDGSSIRDKAVLLVDDVYTTGATVSECARVLKKNGASRVDVLTLARTL